MKFVNVCRIAMVLGTALCLTGCFTIQRAKIKSTDKEHVYVANYGWYLFHTVPVACGNANRDRWLPWVMFRDDVTMDKVQGRFMEYANGQRMGVEDMCYTVTDSVMLSIPGIDLPIPVPYLLTYREVQLSGTLVGADRHPTAEKEDGAK